MDRITPQEWLDELKRQESLTRPFGVSKAVAAGLSWGARGAKAIVALKKRGK